MPITPAVLRQINDAILDIQSSDYTNFDKHIKKLARLLHSSELDPVSNGLIAVGIDLDPWIEAGTALGQQMAGTAKLDWPAEPEKELGTVIRLIDRFAEKGERAALDFALTFYYNGNDINLTMRHMTRQMLIPFARDYIEYVKTKTGEEWITAAEAVRLLKPAFNSEYIAQKAICKRAHNSLIRARAEQFRRDEEKPCNNFDIPQEFWWAEGEASLTQNWTTGDFDTWMDHKVHLQAFGVSFSRADIEKMVPSVPTKRTTPAPAGAYVVIGHGRSPVWRELKDFLEDRLQLPVDEFNRVPVAGVATTARLSQMLDEATIAFLVMTAEDEQIDGEVRARENVVHEIGLFQGRLGFTRAIVLVEEGCEEFSNISGLGQIRFPKGNISAKYEDIRAVLEREALAS